MSSAEWDYVEDFMLWRKGDNSVYVDKETGDRIPEMVEALFSILAYEGEARAKHKGQKAWYDI